jgi:AraC-like DNA-binding protein
MPRPSRSLLTRFSLLDTRSLAAARQATSGFWPKHTSVVLGPEDYALELNRVALGRTALTYVSCTSRIRVISAEPAADFTLYVPLRGEIEMLIDGEQMTATAARPLLRGPVRSFVFEPSPTRCLVVDIPVATMRAAASAAGARLPGHASIDAAPAAAVIRLAARLAAAANRSRSLAALQRFSARDRGARMPEPIRKLEDQLLDVLVHAGGSAAFQRRPPSDHWDVEALKAWLAARAHGPVRMTELATRAGVSQRTVERSFLRTGCTPLEYLRGVRLEHARQMLAAATATTTVAEVARAAGFTHLSRFAIEYRGRFGELPSQALARRRTAR